jgi:hypothetical protein
MRDDYRYPFGQPVLRCTPSASGPRRLFVLGAYPSALHVRWKPEGQPGIKAMAVDNEPEPFWEGNDEERRVDEWKDRVGYQATWGAITPVGDLNGSSGRWVTAEILEPLRVSRADAWVTDCLDTYRCSAGLDRALRERFEPFASEAGLRPDQRPDLAEHPSEAAIVKEAKAEHLDRLRREIATAQPETLVTLGNAALRVLGALVAAPASVPKKLVADATYGTHHAIAVDGHPISWIPLAHPAAPPRYQEAHQQWRRRQPGFAS